MSLSTNVSDLATRVATEVKTLRTLINGNTADLSALTTAAKSSLVAALNELQAEINAINPADLIQDGVTATGTTWSSTKIDQMIQAALDGLLDSAPGTLDTLNELAAALGDDPNFATTVNTSLANRVRVDAAQSFTEPQKTQARANIDAVGVADVGSTTTNYVAVFEAGLV